MHILAAFDKFKNSMSAEEACRAATAGVKDALGSGPTVTQAPLTDGGEGFCPILTHAADGHIEYHTVCGPLGEDVQAPLGWIELAKLPETVRRDFGGHSGTMALIEMASAAGLEQVPDDKRHPKHCTTRGVGELIRIATAQGANAILIGIGGSATNDLGLGALEALGLRFPDATGVTPAQWPSIHRMEGTAIAVPPIFIACDVDNPLTGENGATAVYGPQKGLQADEIEPYDRAMSRLADMLCAFVGASTEIKNAAGSGAAGGIGFGLKTALNASFVPGFDLVARWLDLDAKMSAADLLLTGEGKFDTSSLSGKGPHAMASTAHQKNKPSVLLAGAVDPSAEAAVRDKFPRCEVYRITPEDCPLSKALAEGSRYLRATTASAVGKYAKHDD